MKAVTDSDDKTKADCAIKVDGASVQEFQTIKHTEGNIFSSWIPVEDGQKLSIDAGCNVSTKEVRFDLVVDGVIRSTLQSTSKDWSNIRRTARFQTGFNIVNGVVTDSELVAKTLDVETSGNPQQADAAETVGTIEVRMWVLQQDNELRSAQGTRGFLNCGDWRQLEGTRTYSTIQPTHEVALVPSEWNPLPPIKITNVKKYITAARPGEKPWVVFRFYYRSQEAINGQGLTKAGKLTGKHMLRWTPPKAAKNNDDTETPVTDEAEAESAHPDLGASDLESHEPPTEAGAPSNTSNSSAPPTTSTITIKREQVPTQDADLGPHDSATTIRTNETDQDTDKMPRKSNRSKTPSAPANMPKDPIAEAATAEREAQILQYEATVAPINDLSEETKDALLKEHNKQQEPRTPSPSISRSSSPGLEPEAEEVKPKPVQPATEIKPLPTPASTPVTPKVTNVKLADDKKRKAGSMTPDPASKKENDERAKKLAELHKKVSERRAQRMAAQKKSEEEEACSAISTLPLHLLTIIQACRKLDLDRMEEALMKELADEDELLAEFEVC